MRVCFINNMSNDHPFYYRLVFTVIMIYMALASPLLSLSSVLWKDVSPSLARALPSERNKLASISHGFILADIFTLIECTSENF